MPPTNSTTCFAPPPPFYQKIFRRPFFSHLPKRAMAWRCSAATNDGLITNLKTAGIISSDNVEASMRAVDRAIFLPFNTPNPYQDAPHPLLCSATISAPHMHAMALELLSPALAPGCNALDVGAGSGYLTVCMALMVGNTGHIVGIEHVPQLKQFAEDNISVFHQKSLSCAHISLRAADGRQGAPDKGPFSAIHVGAAAPTIPQSLISQLAPGGLMVIPVGRPGGAQELVLVKKDAHGNITKETVCGVRYVPLCDLDAQLNN